MDDVLVVRHQVVFILVVTNPYYLKLSDGTLITLTRHLT